MPQYSPGNVSDRFLETDFRTPFSRSHLYAGWCFENRDSGSCVTRPSAEETANLRHSSSTPHLHTTKDCPIAYTTTTSWPSDVLIRTFRMRDSRVWGLTAGRARWRIPSCGCPTASVRSPITMSPRVASPNFVHIHLPPPRSLRLTPSARSLWTSQQSHALQSPISPPPPAQPPSQRRIPHGAAAHRRTTCTASSLPPRPPQPADQ